MSFKIEAYCDGSCLGNPGSGNHSAILLLRNEHFTIQKREFKGERSAYTTNNREELKAAILVMNKLDIKTIPITIHTDSMYVISGITKWIHNWKRIGQFDSNSKYKNIDLWIELDQKTQGLDITWQYVRGHSGNQYNERCDELAKEM